MTLALTEDEDQSTGYIEVPSPRTINITDSIYGALGQYTGNQYTMQMDKLAAALLITATLVVISFLGGWFVYAADISKLLMDDFGGVVSSSIRPRTEPMTTLNFSRIDPRTDLRASSTGQGTGLEGNSEYKGYVLGWDYYEGQTCAARNLLGLQHWAGTLELGVVEPFVRNSHLKANDFFSSGRSLRFSNYFNITEWNCQVVSKNYGKPLVTWEQFLEKASRQVIIVYVVISQPRTSVYVNGAITGNCLLMSKGFTNTTLSPFNFKVVRQVCFEFNVHFPLSVNDFNRNIFGNFTIEDVSLVFTFAPGVFASRINLKETNLYHKIAKWLSPSEHVVQHGKKYIEKFLKNEEYLAVAVRTEKLGVSLVKDRHMSKGHFANFLSNCTNEISGLLSNFSEKRFLTLDVGRFGDPKTRSYMSRATTDHFITSMVSVIYNVTWNSAQWEQSFVNATGGITDSGYIALVQKSVVTRATNVISAGSGSFLATMKSNREKLLEAKKGTIYHACKL